MSARVDTVAVLEFAAEREYNGFEPEFQSPRYLELKVALDVHKELIEAAQPFAQYNSSREWIKIEVKSADVERLRRVLAVAQGGPL